MTKASAAPALLFLAVRSARNALVQRARRLREPRYLVGLLIAVAYFALVLRRPGRVAMGRGAGGLDSLPPEALAFAHLVVSALLLGLLALAWVLRRGRAVLALTEGEAHFLFASPLPRSAVLHYALLRPQLGVLFGSFVLTLMSGRAASPGGWRTFAGGWLVLATAQFHFQAMGFLKAKARSWARPARIAVLLGIFGVAVAAVAATALWLVQLGTVLPALPDGRSLLRRGALLWEGLRPWRSRFVPAVLLLPLRLLLAPAFAPGTAAFLAALPGALGVLLLNYLWLVRTGVAFEEATLAAASAKARRSAARLAARDGIDLPAEGRRTVVPFLLAAAGPPELAATWKNLLASGRTRLSTLLRFSVAMVASLAVLPAVLLRFLPDFSSLVAILAGAVAAVGAFIALVSPILRTNDFRGDLRWAATLKTWPLASERLVLGVLLAPWSASLFVLGLALAAGAALAIGMLGAPGGWPGDLEAGWAVAAAGSAIALVPPASAIVLLVQNGAVLAFPSWFASLGRRSAGFEGTGIRLLAMLATTVTLLVALVPAGLLAAPVLYFGLGPLGPVAIPFASLAASVPLWALAWGGVRLLALLWDRFDLSSGTPA